MAEMRSLFEYVDYREYLKAYYADSKARNKNFSFRVFARIAGFKGGNVLKRVMDGDRNLAPQSIPKFAKALRLNKEETHFFKYLVLFNQATDAESRQAYAEELLRSRKHKQIYPMKESQFEFYKKWYLTPLRELVSLPDFDESPEWLAKKVEPHITAYEAARGLQELLKLGLLKRDSRGRLIQADPLITTADEVSSSSVVQFHRQMMRLASDSIDRFPREKRDISAQTFGVSSQGAKKIKEMIQTFRKEVMAVVDQEKNSVEVIYQLNFQLFPISSEPKEESK